MKKTRRILLIVAALCAALLAQPACADPLHDGLVAYWALDEGEGDTAFDTFGDEADNGVLRESPGWMDAGEAILGNSALYFEGYNDVLVTDSMDLEMATNAVTLSAWFSTDLLPDELLENYAGIYDSQQDSYVLYLDKGANELRFKVRDENNSAQRPGVPADMLTTEEWHHVMGVYDGANASAKIYFDGDLVDLHTDAGLIDPVYPGQIAAIGGNALDEASGQYFFLGAIDDVAVWNRALGRAEAVYLYNGGAGNAVGAANPDIAPLPDVIPVEPSADPVIHYAFEANLQNSGSGGAAYDGTLLDTPGINEPPYGPGAVGQGLDLRENPDATGGGDAVSVDYVLTDDGTILFDYAVNKFYNYQSLWTNSVEPNDWEMWIYDTGVLRGRVDADGPVSLDLNAIGGLDNTYQIAFTWQRDGDSVAVELYVDGEFQGQASGGWIEPGETFFIGGGDGGNDYGAGIFDEFKIYDTVLTAGELLYLFQEGGILGDYNDNGELDSGDLDLQADQMVKVDPDLSFDLNGDNAVDFADRETWVNDLKNTWIGDANLDLEFNSSDMVQVFAAGKYETGQNAGWGDGDWNGDTLFDSSDMVAAFAAGGYEQGKKPAVSAVPEPGSLVLLLISLLGLCGRRRQK